jgi:hypothetical protein
VPDVPDLRKSTVEDDSVFVLEFGRELIKRLVVVLARGERPAGDDVASLHISQRGLRKLLVPGEVT